MKSIRTALLLFGVMIILTGVVYPLAVAGLAQLFFPYQANGSQVVLNGEVIGSELIGQEFTKPEYFWGRPSATANQPYNAAASGGSNLGPTNPELTRQIEDRITILRAADPDNTAPIPVDLVTTSASGLDPDISLAAAQYQAARVAKARGLETQVVLNLIDANATLSLFGFIGEERVNVLKLNQALDGWKKTSE